MQCTEPSEKTRIFSLPHFKGEIGKTIGCKNSSSNLFYLVAFNTVVWSSGSPRKLWNENEDFHLHVHLLRCLQIDNSNVRFALFASAMKLKLSPCQSCLKNERLIQPSRMNKQRNEPCNALNLQKGHGYSHFLKEGH